VSEVLPAQELANTERSAFTSEGRLFVIGSRPADRNDAGSWIVEITKNSAGRHLATNYVAGSLEGTADGSLGGAPAGDACTFAGMARHGDVLYASCYAPDKRAALLRVDTRANTVRAGYFTSCNFDPPAADCEYVDLYPNGMAVDGAGRIYVSNTLAYVTLDGTNVAIDVEGTHSLTQIVLEPDPADPSKLAFRHRVWFDTDIFTDGLGPNGVQIEGNVLYYAGGPNINKLTIRDDGRAGDFRIHYRGPLLSYIDDFAIRRGQMALARAIPPAIVGVDAAPFSGTGREVAAFPMPLDRIPSSLAYQENVPVNQPLFPAGSLVVTSFFGGGLHLLQR
jgi:hypothetical protein